MYRFIRPLDDPAFAGGSVCGWQRFTHPGQSSQQIAGIGTADAGVTTLDRFACTDPIQARAAAEAVQAAARERGRRIEIWIMTIPYGEGRVRVYHVEHSGPPVPLPRDVLMLE